MEVPNGLVVASSTGDVSYREHSSHRLVVRLPSLPVRQRVTDFSMAVLPALGWIPIFGAFSVYVVNNIGHWGRWIWLAVMTSAVAAIGAGLVMPFVTFFQSPSPTRQLTIENGILSHSAPLTAFEGMFCSLSYSIPLQLIDSVWCSGDDLVELRARWKPDFLASTLVEGVLLSGLRADHGAFLEAQLQQALELDATHPPSRKPVPSKRLQKEKQKQTSAPSQHKLASTRPFSCAGRFNPGAHPSFCPPERGARSYVQRPFSSSLFCPAPLPFGCTSPSPSLCFRSLVSRPSRFSSPCSPTWGPLRVSKKFAHPSVRATEVFSCDVPQGLRNDRCGSFTPSTRKTKNAPSRAQRFMKSLPMSLTRVSKSEFV